jgi:hypothetical protein
MTSENMEKTPCTDVLERMNGIAKPSLIPGVYRDVAVEMNGTATNGSDGAYTTVAELMNGRTGRC